MTDRNDEKKMNYVLEKQSPQKGDGSGVKKIEGASQSNSSPARKKVRVKVKKTATPVEKKEEKDSIKTSEGVKNAEESAKVRRVTSVFKKKEETAEEKNSAALAPSSLESTEKDLKTTKVPETEALKNNEDEVNVAPVPTEKNEKVIDSNATPKFAPSAPSNPFKIEEKNEVKAPVADEKKINEEGVSEKKIDDIKPARASSHERRNFSASSTVIFPYT